MPEARNNDTPFPLTAIQTLDISTYLKALNEAEKDLNIYNDEYELGSGYRAIIVDPIRIYTDTEGTVELLGWIKSGEFDSSYVFTQIDPTK